MTPQPGGTRTGAFRTDPALARRVAIKRFLARLVLFAERLLPLFLPLAGIAAIFVSLAWLGVYRQLPDVVRLGLVFALTFAFVASLLPFARLRWSVITSPTSRWRCRTTSRLSKPLLPGHSGSSTSGAWPKRSPRSMPDFRDRTFPGSTAMPCAPFQRFSSSRRSPIPVRTAPA